MTKPVASGSGSAEAGPHLRVCRPPWKGEAVFACAKCQRKMKKGKGPKPLRKLRKWFRKMSAKHPERSDVCVIDIPCVDLCPKGGVTVFSARQLAGTPSRISILRSESDLEKFYCQMAPTDKTLE